jgi:alginate O-acetyltransferase complex protein AlgI
MLFNSVQFICFFILVTGAYFLLPHRRRWVMLLGASCYFYMAFVPVYILILIFTIVIDYFAAIWIESSAGRRRRMFLVASLLANCGVLAFFKYYNFLNDTLLQTFNLLGLRYPIPFLNIVLPIGLSFHTFQAMSYTIEVYRGTHRAERHFGIYSLYVMYYPQLVAGPIERPNNLLDQFRKPQTFDYDRVTAGLKLMLWGFFQKVVVADRLAPFVNQVYGNPSAYGGPSLAVATVFFAFQIYADFAGYSDIAIGASQVMGIKLMTNFRRPYFSTSIAEFWKRWHISLSTWFRDYLYISLGGNRVALGRWLFNLFFTFLVSGLWHGAQWTFVVWGGLNGAYLIMEIGASRLAGWGGAASRLAWLFNPPKLLRIALTFALTCFAWIFFRANTCSDAFYIVGHLGAGWAELVRHASDVYYLKASLLLGHDSSQFLGAIAAIAALLAVHLLQERGSLAQKFGSYPAAVRWAVYYASVIVILFFGAFNSSQQFIYFQF